MLELLSAGWLTSKTVGEPGAQGAKVIGKQGWGCNTPNAAAVAAATIGLPRLLHIPKGRMFKNGIWAIIFAAGKDMLMSIVMGKTINEEGAAPIQQLTKAPLTTCIPIFTYPSFLLAALEIGLPFLSKITGRV
jgi:hypothetical protein